MAFPLVAATSTANGFGTAVTSSLPSGTAAGDLLVLVNARAQATTTTWPAGWTPILTNTATGSAFEVGYRWHQAGDSAPALTLGVSSIWVNRMFRVTGAHASTPPEATALALGTSTGPDPAALNPGGWDAEDTLWIAACTYSLTSDPTSYPAGYSGGAAARFSGALPSLATASREAATASEDPGAFTIASSVAWRAATIGIRPAGGAAPPPASGGSFLPFLI